MERTARFLERVREIARECGYAVGVHGSMKPERDLDLIAVPWTPEAVSADHLVTTLCERVPLHERPANVYPDGLTTTNPEPKAWGRWAWSLAGCPEHEYVDLSVAPRVGEPVPLTPYKLYEAEAADFVSGLSPESLSDTAAKPPTDE